MIFTPVIIRMPITIVIVLIVVTWRIRLLDGTSLTVIVITYPVVRSWVVLGCPHPGHYKNGHKNQYKKYNSSIYQFHVNHYLRCLAF